MNPNAETNELQAPGLNIHEVLRSFFKHKWKVIFFALAGLGGAAYVWFTHVTVFETRAKIYIKYIDEWNKDQDKMVANTTSYIIQPELDILTSSDISRDVVGKVGAARIAPAKTLPGLATPVALAQVMANFEAYASNGKVILLAYRHPDPEVAVAVLNEILTSYKRRHIAIHHPADILAMMDTQKLDIQSDLTKVDGKLNELKKQLSMNSLEDGAKFINSILLSTQQDLNKATVTLQWQRARVAALENLLGIAAEAKEKEPANAVGPAADPALVQEYQALVQRRERARLREEEYSQKYDDTSADVRAVRAQIKACDEQIAAMQKNMPTLGPLLVPSKSGDAPKVDLMAERAELKASEAQYKALVDGNIKVQEQWKKFIEIAPEIEALERERKRKAEALDKKSAQLDDARSEEALDLKKMTNIETIQSPSPPMPALDKLMKGILGFALGGLGLGLGIVFLREFFVDQSVKQPLEIETRLGIPLIMAIPEQDGAARLKNGASKSGEIVPWEEGHFIRPFAEAIRDRLVLHFEQSGLIRKPKLVGVTGWTAGAGTSTLASGVAAALSETGDGKVLLVDMNVRGGEVHPFFKGEAAALLPDALKSSDNVQSAAENLYIATASTQNGEAEIIPKRFYNLIPNFKASDYDYIIFDMPPLSKGSMTLAMAGFMDRMLLVVESEKDNRNVLKRACSELRNAKAQLCGVLNKVRTYGPAWLQEA
jgi:succinoglycan biosynthesis transport protein ExoP